MTTKRLSGSVSLVNAVQRAGTTRSSTRAVNRRTTYNDRCVVSFNFSTGVETGSAADAEVDVDDDLDAVDVAGVVDAGAGTEWSGCARVVAPLASSLFFMP